MLGLNFGKRKHKKVTIGEAAKKTLNGHSNVNVEEEDEDFIEPEDEIVELKNKIEALQESLKHGTELISQRDKEIEGLKKKIYDNQEWMQNLIIQLVTQQGNRPKSAVEEYIAKKQGLAAVEAKAK